MWYCVVLHKHSKPVKTHAFFGKFVLKKSTKNNYILIIEN